MMSPLEELAEAKRSGLYHHPETEKNWPEKDTTGGAVTEIPKDMAPPKTSPKSEQIPQDIRIQANFPSEESFLTKNWPSLLNTLLIILLAAYLYFKKSPAPAVQPPPVKTVIKRVPPVASIAPRKPLVRKKNRPRQKPRKEVDTWRKQACQKYGDWDACLAYKNNIPFRARLNRIDLLK